MKILPSSVNAGEVYEAVADPWEKGGVGTQGSFFPRLVLEVGSSTPALAAGLGQLPEMRNEVVICQMEVGRSSRHMA